MTSEELALARVLFRLRVHESNGQSFEDLFVNIFRLTFPQFVCVKPQGNIGDRKNDGYDKANGTYFQVYAPEEIKESESQAVKKLKTDFAGLKAYWNKIHPIKSYHFVMNDKFKGTFPTIENDLSEIKKEHALERCSCLLAKHLEDALFVLSDDKIFSIIGFIPSADKISTLNYSVLNSVVRHIVEFNRSAPAAQLLQVPDFSDKIAVNNLSPRIAGLLWSASNQVGIFEGYFEKNSTFSKQLLRDHLNKIYQAALEKEHPPLSEGLTESDYVFMDILQTASPEQTQEYYNATLVVMAAFFESCDIFEEPGQASLSL